jgi:hypothetical protein
VEVWLGEVGYDVNVGEQELSQLVITSDLQPDPGQKCSGTERGLHVSSGIRLKKLIQGKIMNCYLKYECCLKSSRTGGSAPLLCLPLHNSSTLLPVHELFKRT